MELQVICEWIAIDNRMPENSQKVIYFVASEGNIEAGYYDADQRAFIIGIEGAMGYDEEDISHWMPFPPPPATA